MFSIAYVWGFYILIMSILASLLLLHVHVQIEDVPLEVLWVISWSLRLFYHLLRDTAHIEANCYLIFQNTAEFVLLLANVSKFPWLFRRYSLTLRTSSVCHGELDRKCWCGIQLTSQFLLFSFFPFYFSKDCYLLIPWRYVCFERERFSSDGGHFWFRWSPELVPSHCFSLV